MGVLVEPVVPALPRFHSAIYDVGTHQDSPFLVTELLEGETLRERIQRGPMPMTPSVIFSLGATFRSRPST